MLKTVKMTEDLTESAKDKVLNIIRTPIFPIKRCDIDKEDLLCNLLMCY